MKNINSMIIIAGCFTLLTAFIYQQPKRLFLLGDSISLQYKPFLQPLLKGQFVIEQKSGDSLAFKNLDIPAGANGGDSRMVLKFLKAKLSDDQFRPDLFLLNCGLHDVKHDPATQKIAVEESEYRSNLENIQQLLSSRKIPMIWIRTTGIIDSIHRKNKGFDRYLKDIERYNTIAHEVFSSRHVPEIDLFSFTALQGPKRFVDHAHYTMEVRALQASYIAGFVNGYSR